MYRSEVVQSDLKNIMNQNIDFEKLYNKTVLITGASGMIASYYMYTLMYLNDTKDANIKIYALVMDMDRLEKITELSTRNDIIPIVQDVCNPIYIPEKVDYIIHMASSANPRTITKDPVGIIKANVIGTLNVLELAKKNEAEVLFTSTREIYGEIQGKEKIKETDMGVLECLELRSCYPESKRMAENLMVSFAYQYNIKYKIVRIAHAYGPGMIINNDGRIMSDLISYIVNKENIVLKSTGDAKRAFCYITDVVSALLMITVMGKPNEAYNISNETEEISVKDLAFMMKEMYQDTEVVFNIEENKNEYVKFKRVPLDTTKLEALGWKPRVSLKNGIENTVRYFNEID